MKSIYLLSFLVLFLIPGAYAQTDETDEVIAGVTPDEFLGIPWFFDKIGDDLRFELADDTTGEKSRIGLEIVKERLHEDKIMMIEEKFEFVQQIREDHNTKLTEIAESVELIEIEDNQEEFKIKIEIEQRIKDHSDEIDEVEKEIEIEIKGKITDEQLRQIQQIFDGIDNNADKVKIKIEIEREETEDELEDEDHLSKHEISKLRVEHEDEIDDEMESEDDEIEQEAHERSESNSDSSNSNSGSSNSGSGSSNSGSSGDDD